MTTWEPRWYARNGDEITVEQAASFGHDYRIVEQTQIGPYFVSTVWLGIDHAFGSTSQPVLFETMVFSESDEHTLGPDVDARRWCTEEDAVRGHAEMVLLVRATTQDAQVEDE